MATLHDLARQQAIARGLDPTFVARLIHQESRGNPAAVSPAGALGVMQIMPRTGQGLGVANPAALLDPTTNIDAGTRYLAQLSTQFHQNPFLMAAAYNAGPGRVGRLVRTYGENPSAIYPHLPSETQKYTLAVAGAVPGIAPSKAPLALPPPPPSPYRQLVGLLPADPLPVAPFDTRSQLLNLMGFNRSMNMEPTPDVAPLSITDYLPSRDTGSALSQFLRLT